MNGIGHCSASFDKARRRCTLRAGGGRWVRRAWRREDGGGSCRLREGACRRGEPSPSPPERGAGQDWPLIPVPRTGSASRRRGRMRENGDPDTQERQSRAGSRSPSPRDATAPAAIPAWETQKPWTQPGARGLPVSAACPRVSTSADSGLLRATGHAPVTSSTRARPQLARPAPREEQIRAAGGGVCAGADRDQANSWAGLVFPGVALLLDKLLLIAKSCYVRKNKLLKYKSALFIPVFFYVCFCFCLFLGFFTPPLPGKPWCRIWHSAVNGTDPVPS